MWPRYRFCFWSAGPLKITPMALLVKSLITWRFPVKPPGFASLCTLHIGTGSSFAAAEAVLCLTEGSAVSLASACSIPATRARSTPPHPTRDAQRCLLGTRAIPDWEPLLCSKRQLSVIIEKKGLGWSSDTDWKVLFASVELLLRFKVADSPHPFQILLS